MNDFKLYISSVLITSLFSGCFGTVILAGTAASAASTTQEVDEEYDGSFMDYLSDKYDNLIRYIEENTDED